MQGAEQLGARQGTKHPAAVQGAKHPAADQRLVPAGAEAGGVLPPAPPVASAGVPPGEVPGLPPGLAPVLPEGLLPGLPPGLEVPALPDPDVPPPPLSDCRLQADKDRAAPSTAASTMLRDRRDRIMGKLLGQ